MDPQLGDYVRYTDWHARHLEDRTSIRVLPSIVQQEKGLGITRDGLPFTEIGGNIRYDLPQDGYGFSLAGVSNQTLDLPDYG